MERALTFVEAARPRLRVALARLLQTVGWAGVMGVAHIVHEQHGTADIDQAVAGMAGVMLGQRILCGIAAGGANG